MASNFPTSLDSFTDPIATNALNSPSHSSQHTNINDIMVQVETKLGINGSAVNTTVDYFLAHGGATGFGAGSNNYRLTFFGTSAPGGPLQAGDHWYDTTNTLLKMYDGTEWITITPVTAALNHSGTTTSTAFGTALTGDSGTNPQVTILTGTQALVTITATISNNTASDGAAATWAVSGATTISASTTFTTNGMGLSLTNNANTAGLSLQHAATYKVTGLTAGSNVFTMNYAAITGGTATFNNRSMTVVAVPAGG